MQYSEFDARQGLPVAARKKWLFLEEITKD
jgi:hypothetical protein